MNCFCGNITSHYKIKKNYIIFYKTAKKIKKSIKKIKKLKNFIKTDVTAVPCRHLVNTVAVIKKKIIQFI
jgi:hypothetical protein